MDHRSQSGSPRQSLLPSILGSRELVTKEFLGKRRQLFDAESSLGGGGELPAEHLSDLVPSANGWLGEEINVLPKEEYVSCNQGEGKPGSLAHTRIWAARRTLGLFVSMLYHKMDAQAFGIWQMLEITTTGRE